MVIASVLAQSADVSLSGWLFILGVAVVLILFIAAIILSERKSIPYTAALVAVAPMALFMAGLCTIVSYLLRFQPLPDVITDTDTASALVGVLLGVIFWLILAWFYCLFRFPMIDGANPRIYEQLCQRLDQLEAQLEVLCPEPSRKPIDPETQGIPAQEAAQEAWKQRDFLHTALQHKPKHHDYQAGNDPQNAMKQRDRTRLVQGLQWVCGNGYIDLWNRVHRAEEALLQLEPTSELVGEVMNDRMRLTGSRIDQQSLLQSYLKGAAVALGVWFDSDSAGSTAGSKTGTVAATKASANGKDKSHNGKPQSTDAATVVNVIPQPTRALATGDATQLSAGTTTTATARTEIDGDAEKETVEVTSQNGAKQPQGAVEESPEKARSALVYVRQSINEFRDDRWDSLVGAKDMVMQTTITAGIAAYAVLVLTMLMHVPRGALEAATVFFLVGALTGLFERLRRATSTSVSVEDYGLGHARLINTPLYSGIAALVGVALFAFAPSLFAKLEVLQPGTATPTPTAITTTVPAATPAGSGIATQVPTTPSTNGGTDTTASNTPVPNNPLPTLDSIYSLDTNPLGLLIAAIFGLTPSLLTRTLQQQTDDIKLDIKSTDAQHSRTKAGAGAAGSDKTSDS